MVSFSILRPFGPSSDRVEWPRCSRRRSAQVVIDRDKKDAAVVKEKVLVQEASATEISERAGAIAADAQADLDKALPALAAAVQCLKELKKAHIDEVKALKKPPGGVRLTLEVACVFFEVAPVKKPDPEDPSKKIFDYVEPAGKSLLSNAGKFLEMLQDFDKDNIPDKVIKKVGPYIENPDFTPKMCDLRVLTCCGAFTLSMRLVSRRRGRGWFLFRF